MELGELGEHGCYQILADLDENEIWKKTDLGELFSTNSVFDKFRFCQIPQLPIYKALFQFFPILVIIIDYFLYYNL